eukprot:7333123-Prymnesium_polylepis.1
MAPFGSSVRKSQANGAKKRKGKGHDPDMTENRIIARIEADTAKLAAIRAAKSPATGKATRT